MYWDSNEWQIAKDNPQSIAPHCTKVTLCQAFFLIRRRLGPGKKYTWASLSKLGWHAINYVSRFLDNSCESTCPSYTTYQVQGLLYTWIGTKKTLKKEQVNPFLYPWLTWWTLTNIPSNFFKENLEFGRPWDLSSWKVSAIFIPKKLLM